MIFSICNCRKTIEDRLTYFCCFNHYLIDDHCQECENGTRAIDGLECLPCDPNFYGHKCKYECKCESEQRCDPVSGCRDKPTKFSKVGMSSFFQSQNNIKSTKTSEANPKLTTIPKETSEANIKSAKTSEANPKLTTIPKETSEASTGIQVLCYMILAAGLITWMIVCLKCSTCLPRMIGRKRSRQSTRHVPTCQMQEVSNNCKNKR